MKKTILLLLALLVYCGSDAQQIQTARNYIATNIVTNGTNQITAVKMNTALNLMLNADSVNYKIIIDSMGKYTLLRDSTTKFVTPYQLGISLATKQNALGYTAESTSNKTTDANGSSNALYPTQGAVKSYVDAVGGSVSSQLVDTALAIQNRLNAKQATLVSGTNIKTINGTSLLGSGDITISGGGTATDTSYLRADIEARVKYTDTPGMLGPYATDAQLADSAAALRTLANTKQNSLSGTGFVKASGSTISYDNSTYLTSYTETDPLAVKLADSATKYSTIKRLSDSSAAIRASIPTVSDKQSFSDTSTWDATKKNLIDSAGAIQGRINLKIDSLRRLPGSTAVQQKINGTWVTAFTDSVGGGGGGGTGWGLTGNSGLSGSTNFVGNTDNVDFNIRVNNQVVAKFANNEGLSIGNNATTTGLAAISIGVNSANTGIAGISLGYQASNNSVNNGIALGRLCQVNHGGAFVSQDYSGSNAVASSADNQWKAKFNGGFLFQTGTSTHTTQLTIKTSGIINITNTPTYADNTAALAGGLVAGDVYRTSTGVLMIVY